MQLLSRMKPVIVAALLCAVLVTLSVLYVDRPVTAFVYRHVPMDNSALLLFFEAMASPSLLPMPCAVVYLCIHALRKLAGRPAFAQAGLYLRLCIAIAVATLAKDELKSLIGRPWPYTWVKMGAYAIKPFSNGELYGSFPSGHTTYIAAPMFVLWWCLPKYRALWLGLILSVMIGLVCAGYHFVADVIAGFFLGLAGAKGTLMLWPLEKPGVLLSEKEAGRPRNQTELFNPAPRREKIPASK